MKKLITTSLVAGAALFFVDAPANEANAGFRISFGNQCGGFSHSNPYRWEKVRYRAYNSCGHFIGWRYKWVKVYY